MKRAAKKLGLALSHTPIDRIAGVISRAKNDLLTPESFEPRWGRPVDDVARKLWPVYQELLLAANAVDFDDLLVHLARLLAADPELRAALDARHRFILVDEYQDTNAVQYAIIRGLSIDHPNIAVTGDPDQAIYGWRGASIRNILEFERDYPAARVVTLEHNYRSTANILGTADRLIAHNSRRKPKRLVTSADPGERVRIVLDASGQDEAERIAAEIAAAVQAGRRTPRDFVILFRTAALSRSLEIALRTAGVPYQLVRGLEFFKRREIRDVVAWLRLLRNPRDDEAFLRVVNVPARGIGRQSLERLAAWAEDHGSSRLAAAAAADRIPGMPKKAARELPAFARLHAALGETAGREPSVAALLESVLEQTGYRRQLQDESEDDEEGLERLANVEELVTAARQYDESLAAAPGAGGGEVDPLGGFLETTALVADADAWDAGAERVALMTFHAAKGLEFPVVYLVAMEDGILPHERSLDQPEQLEEERRLVFVGITRAREEVHASCARMRDYRGTRRISAPSVFLAEMTGSETVVTGDEAPAAGERPVFDPFGDAARAAADEFAEWVHEEPSATAPRLKVYRPDGLTLETEESQAEDGAAGPERGPGRKRRDRAGDRATDLATWATPQAGSPGAEPRFEPGQRVRHAEYGEGVLVKISGVGTRSVGTVSFDGPAGTRKFLLGHGGILPAE
jgi:DNA helicase-2/ATP-dependent DNA helicase PcrA